MSPPTPRILLTGASIAGPTTAYWLSRALPTAHLTVIERSPFPRPGGQNIDIRTHAVTVMRRTPGLETAVREKVVEMDGLGFMKEGGGCWGTIKATGDPEEQGLISEYEILRGDLSALLVNLTKGNDRVKYIYGEQALSISQPASDGPVTVEFMNGKLPTGDYDLVIACDGSTSRTRALGLGCQKRDFVNPTSSWAAYFTIPEDLVAGSKMGHGFSAPGGRFLALGYDSTGGSGNRVTMMAVNQAETGMDAFRTAQKKGDEAVKNFIANTYEEAGWLTPQAVEGMTDSPDFYASEIVQVKLPSLSKGRFVLVGDAGYAPGPTGGGTTLAMVGGYVLAGEIAKAKGDWGVGLKGYEEVMRPMMTDLQKIPLFVQTIMAPQTVWGVWVRNHVFAFICWAGVFEFVQKYAANAFGKADECQLPDYEWEG